MGAGIDGRAECQTHQLRPLTISATGWHGAVSSLSADLEAQWHVFRRRDLYRTTIARNNNCALAHNNLGLLLAKMVMLILTSALCLRTWDEGTRPLPIFVKQWK
jgi:hypothetical protein